MKKKVLILFAHPALEKSRVHRVLIKSIRNMEGVYINDLYESYPDFDIDVEHEKQLLLDHDIIVWQHPFFWYSGPAMLKQWMDLVLQHGWAYGKAGHELDGKVIFNAMSSGGGMQAYHIEGYQRTTLHDLLIPFQRTAELCRMIYLPPFWVAGTHKLEADEINEYADQYKKLITILREDIYSKEDLLAHTYLNDLLISDKTS